MTDTDVGSGRSIPLKQVDFIITGSFVVPINKVQLRRQFLGNIPRFWTATKRMWDISWIFSQWRTCVSCYQMVLIWKWDEFLEAGEVSFTGPISQDMIKGHCFFGRLLNQTVFLQSKSTCWIGFRARRPFWSFLFICAMVTCILTCGMWSAFVKKYQPQVAPMKMR